MMNLYREVEEPKYKKTKTKSTNVLKVALIRNKTEKLIKTLANPEKLNKMSAAEVEQMKALIDESVKRYFSDTVGLQLSDECRELYDRLITGVVRERPEPSRADRVLSELGVTDVTRNSQKQRVVKKVEEMIAGLSPEDEESILTIAELINSTDICDTQFGVVIEYDSLKKYIEIAKQSDKTKKEAEDISRWRQAYPEGREDMARESGDFDKLAKLQAEGLLDELGVTNVTKSGQKLKVVNKVEEMIAGLKPEDEEKIRMIGELINTTDICDTQFGYTIDYTSLKKFLEIAKQNENTKKVAERNNNWKHAYPEGRKEAGIKEWGEE